MLMEDNIAVELPISPAEGIKFRAVVHCSSKANYEFRPSFRVEYKDPSSPYREVRENYTFLGDVKDGVFETELLELRSSL